MKFDSIKSRLVLMTFICVMGMGLLFASQQFFTHELVRLNQQRDLLLRLGQDLLQMRRHEKDFLLRHQLTYFEQFNKRAEQFSIKLNQLDPLFAHYELPVDQAGELASGVHQYQQLFQRLVSVQTTMGLRPDQGLLGELATLEASLERLPAFNYGTPARQHLVEAELAVRNFQLSRDSFYQQKAEQSLATLNAIMGNDKPDDLLNRYAGTFKTLVDEIHQFGVTHNDGLRGQFRRQAHQVEAQLTRIDQAMQPLIQAQEDKVKGYSVSIAALTSIALILLLIKSFATFHRAFANFVMFFYRCKRQYQKIDPRQLGFAEFKSLAELANEMVESRRDIEHRLAKAEEALQQTGKSQPVP